MYKQILFTVALSVATMAVSAQKLSGSISPLKGQKEVNVVLDFSGMLVNNQPEESHIAYSTKDKNEEEKAEWLLEWNEKLRENSYAKLVTDLNKATVKKGGFSVGDYPNAEYTIYIKVINIDPGYFAGIMGKAAMLWTEVSFVKTGETTPFATVKYDRVFSGMGDVVAYFVSRIAMSFGTLGDKIGSTISKNLK